MVWPRLTNSKPLLPLLQHLPNKEIAGVPVSGVTLISLTTHTIVS